MVHMSDIFIIKFEVSLLPELSELGVCQILLLVASFLLISSFFPQPLVVADVVDVETFVVEEQLIVLKFLDFVIY